VPDLGKDPGRTGVPVLNIPGRPDPVRLARVALACIVRDSDTRVHRLAHAYGPEGALDRLLTGQERGIDATRYGDLPGLAADTLRRAQRLGARVVTPEDDEWPPHLDDLAKVSDEGDGPHRLSPLCLWVRGNASLAELLERSAAVVGSRAASPYGIHVATVCKHLFWPHWRNFFWLHR
jgi:DNA processing protein